ncbi:MAG: hypothetical protein AVDCRST_MAG28-673 [uncultured Rubrobacteraceae bacterium]|uniref:Uncharacterized protein n=1 Tax=uncultured Rubrobacteraceae bacterium TaxID=349277 RepID=A0A6J4QIW2_9ACTN|nr:MAG: hypothetical protein AVDCRST_MAG28-673 [uncultured Rubrobacteraceae bacterium]
MGEEAHSSWSLGGHPVRKALRLPDLCVPLLSLLVFLVRERQRSLQYTADSYSWRHFLCHRKALPNTGHTFSGKSRFSTLRIPVG